MLQHKGSLVPVSINIANAEKLIKCTCDVVRQFQRRNSVLDVDVEHVIVLLPLIKLFSA